MRLLCLACALLISLSTTLPIYAADAAGDVAPTRVSQPDATNASPQVAQPAPSTLGLRTDQKVLVGSSEPTAHPVTTYAPTVTPVEVAHSPAQTKHSLLSNGAVDLIAGGLLMIPFDRSLDKSFPKASNPGSADTPTEIANSFGTPLVLLPLIGGVYLSGDKATAKEALSALATVSIWTQGLKMLTGRERPLVGDQKGSFMGPSIGGGRESFPSGHTAAAFAVATVLAHKHPKQKWLYYGLASAVGFARIRKSAHFPSDVLVGAGVGMFAGEQAVNHSRGLLSITF